MRREDGPLIETLGSGIVPPNRPDSLAAIHRYQALKRTYNGRVARARASYQERLRQAEIAIDQECLRF